ncbi:hypothetical protein Agub_g723, partial [Astrephomene gubernaculifera]
MSLAQQLYEGAGTGEGLITYMRTDGVAMSPEAVAELRRANTHLYGAAAVPPQPRQYKSRAKNAQEAHEAIRPTRPASLPPAALPPDLPPDLRALYELVWRRAAASQMSSAVYEVVTIELAADGGRLGLRAGGSQLRDPGFLRAYEDVSCGEEEEEQQQGRRGAEGEVEEEEAAAAALVAGGSSAGSRENQGLAAQQLLQLQPGNLLQLQRLHVTPHATRPPPRFTEASLVRALEERGIGRPSTYAPIMSLLQDRGYVSREGRSLVPTPLGRVLSAFLEHYFPTWVDYDFTSGMEASLDDIASGKAAWRHVLSSFWGPFSSAVAAMSAVSTTQVFDTLDAALADYLFPRRRAGAAGAGAAGAAAPLLPEPGSSNNSSSSSSGGSVTIDVVATTVSRTEGTEGVLTREAGAAEACSDPRVCPKCGVGRLVLKPSRHGGFIGCTKYADPDIKCDYARPLLPVIEGGEGEGEAGATPASATERLLGRHPDSGEAVWVRLGPYGLYVQLGELAAGKKAAGASKEE